MKPIKNMLCEKCNLVEATNTGLCEQCETGQKPKCKYCGKVHKHLPFVDCHNPTELIPDNLEDSYIQKFGR